MATSHRMRNSNKITQYFDYEDQFPKIEIQRCVTSIEMYTVIGCSSPLSQGCQNHTPQLIENIRRFTK